MRPRLLLTINWKFAVDLFLCQGPSYTHCCRAPTFASARLSCNCFKSIQYAEMRSVLPSDCVHIRYCNEIISIVNKIILQSRGRIVHCVVAKRPRGETSRGRNVLGAKRPGGELTKGRNVQLPSRVASLAKKTVIVQQIPQPYLLAVTVFHGPSS